jgi:hypothetical protein
VQNIVAGQSAMAYSELNKTRSLLNYLRFLRDQGGLLTLPRVPGRAEGGFSGGVLGEGAAALGDSVLFQVFVSLLAIFVYVCL